MKYIITVLIMTITLGLGGWNMAAASDQGDREAVFSIDKMTCALCPLTVRKAMEKVAGVRDVKVDFKAKTATVHFTPSTATVEAIALASTNAGYPAHISGEK